MLFRSLLLYFTATQRESARIITDQVKNVEQKNTQAIEAMHNLKAQALQMKDHLIRGELAKMGEILRFGWENKKRMAQSISNLTIDEIYEAALNAGASGGKISGAGGGGFMFFFCPGVTKISVAKSIERFGGKVQPFKFTSQGLTTWTI